MKALYFITLWGKPYVDTFLNYSLKSVLTKGNLPAVEDQVFLINTDSEGLGIILKHKEYEKLTKVCKVIFNMLNISSREGTLRTGFEKANLIAKELGACMRCIAPDVIISDGSLTNSLKYMETKRATALPSAALRVNKETFCKEFDEYAQPPTEPRKLVELFLKHIHKETYNHSVNTDRFFLSPVQVLFNGENGYKVHSFYNQPGFCFPSNINTDNFEFDYIKQMVKDASEVEFITDSDIAFEVSLTEDKYDGYGEAKFNSDLLRVNMDGRRNRFSDICFAAGYSIHTGKELILDEKMQTKEKEVVGEVVN